MRETALNDRTFTLVLGGGGMKGLAHVGVLRALEDVGARPARIVGSSVGALVAASWLSGLTAAELEEIALQLTRRDLFQVAHRNMALKRMRSPSLYRGEPLEHLVRGLLGDVTFDELELPLFVNSVDVNAGTQVFWGASGFHHVSVADAVIASCSLPGYLPPKEIEGRMYVDGAAVSNFPIRITAALEQDLVVGVDVGSSGLGTKAVEEAGFAAVYARAIELAIETMRTTDLRHWTTPPLVLLQPRVEDVGLFEFRRNAELVAAGYLATREVLDDPDAIPATTASGVYPRHRYAVRVDRSACIGCGACVINAPAGMFRLDAHGKAVPDESPPRLARIEAAYVAKQCPTGAISVERRNKREAA